MRKSRVPVLFVAGLIVAALAIAAAPMARAGAVTDDNVEQALASAKTAADHQALADYFKAKAATANANVALHERMIKGARLPGPARERWQEHCNRLVAAYKEQAKDYGAMAAEEAKLGAEAK